MTRMEEINKRLDNANLLIFEIATRGRGFLTYKGQLGKLTRDSWGKIWYFDPCTERSVYLHFKGVWRGFTPGGTLRCLIEALRDYIVSGVQFRSSTFGPWRLEAHGWGYPEEDMATIRNRAAELGITVQKVDTL